MRLEACDSARLSLCACSRLLTVKRERSSSEAYCGFATARKLGRQGGLPPVRSLLLTTIGDQGPTCGCRRIGLVNNHRREQKKLWGDDEAEKDCKI